MRSRAWAERSRPRRISSPSSVGLGGCRLCSRRRDRQAELPEQRDRGQQAGGGEDDRRREGGLGAVGERGQRVGALAWETATVERIATPTAPPIWNEELLRPDASPASASATPASEPIEPAT